MIEAAKEITTITSEVNVAGSNLNFKRIILRIIEEKNKGFKNSLFFFTSRLLRYSRLCYFFTLDLAGCKIQFSPLAVPTALFVSGDLEPETTIFLQGHLQSGDVYVDIGANVGTTTLVAAKAVGESGIILCFEPNKKTYKALITNINKNNFSNILAKQCALGSKEGTVLFSDKNSDDMNRVSVVGEGDTVPLSTLDSYTKNIGKIKLLKIDVEGYEMEVLQGSVQTLKKTEMVLFESIERNALNYGRSISEIILFLKQNNFRIVDMGFTMEYNGTKASDQYPTNLVGLKINNATNL